MAGVKGRSGRKRRSSEEEYLAAFGQALTVAEFRRMTDDLTALYWRKGTPAALKLKIWEKVSAYALGLPKQTVETGPIGERDKLREQALAALLAKDKETSENG